MMPCAKTIAIDGPAASGKSTLGKKLAEKLNYLYLDTGVMYRAITWLALSRGIDPRDEATVTRLAEITEIDIRPPSIIDGRDADIIAGDEDITWDIRRREVEENVSLISSYEGVRLALSDQQRRIGLKGNIVMVGRDIGTVVLPEADVKIYLDASAEERARRRYLEKKNRGENVTYDSILESMRKRDEIDSSRDFAPLKPAKDAILIQSEHLDAQEVFLYALNLVMKDCP